MGLVHGPFLQHFRVSQDDTELVVQPVKQAAHLVRGSMLAHLGVSRVRSWAHTCPTGLAAPVDAALVVAGVASRHSVSAKMRMDPPAVRTYSTFPAAIQLYIVRRLTPTASHAFMMDKVWRSIVDSRLAPGHSEGILSLQNALSAPRWNPVDRPSCCSVSICWRLR